MDESTWIQQIKMLDAVREYLQSFDILMSKGVALSKDISDIIDSKQSQSYGSRDPNFLNLNQDPATHVASPTTITKQSSMQLFSSRKVSSTTLADAASSKKVQKLKGNAQGFMHVQSELQDHYHKLELERNEHALVRITDKLKDRIEKVLLYKKWIEQISKLNAQVDANDGTSPCKASTKSNSNPTLHTVSSQSKSSDMSNPNANHQQPSWEELNTYVRTESIVLESLIPEFISMAMTRISLLQSQLFLVGSTLSVEFIDKYADESFIPSQVLIEGPQPIPEHVESWIRSQLRAMALREADMDKEQEDILGTDLLNQRSGPGLQSEKSLSFKHSRSDLSNRSGSGSPTKSASSRKRPPALTSRQLDGENDPVVFESADLVMDNKPSVLDLAPPPLALNPSQVHPDNAANQDARVLQTTESVKAKESQQIPAAGVEQPLSVESVPIPAQEKIGNTALIDASKQAASVQEIANSPKKSGPRSADDSIATVRETGAVDMVLLDADDEEDKNDGEKEAEEEHDKVFGDDDKKDLATGLNDFGAFQQSGTKASSQASPSSAQKQSSQKAHQPTNQFQSMPSSQPHGASQSHPFAKFVLNSPAIKTGSRNVLLEEYDDEDDASLSSYASSEVQYQSFAVVPKGAQDRTAAGPEPKVEDESAALETIDLEPSCSKASKPTAVFVRCLYDFKAEEEIELSFRKGDIIEVLYRNKDGWWEGRLKGTVGLFPVNFVELVRDGR